MPAAFLTAAKFARMGHKPLADMADTALCRGIPPRVGRPMLANSALASHRLGPCGGDEMRTGRVSE